MAVLGGGVVSYERGTPVARGQTGLFNSGTNSKFGTSRVQFVLGFSSHRELKAINTRSICPLAIRARVCSFGVSGFIVPGLVVSGIQGL